MTSRVEHYTKMSSFLASSDSKCLAAPRHQTLQYSRKPTGERQTLPMEAAQVAEVVYDMTSSATPTVHHPSCYTKVM